MILVIVTVSRSFLGLNEIVQVEHGHSCSTIAPQNTVTTEYLALRTEHHTFSG